jgi:hypothetical protein
VVSSQRLRSCIVKIAGALVITVITSGLAAELGAGVAGLLGAAEAGGAITAGALAARAGGAVVNLAVNVTVNSALQYAMSEGHDSMGWALVENALMELGTRGLAKTLRAPMSRLHDLEREALRDGRRLRELASIERTAARRGAALSDSLEQEREALLAAREGRAGWFITQLTLEMAMGMASQWAARSLLQTVRGPDAAVSDDFASNVLQQGAAIMLGKKLFGLKAAWQARRIELEGQPWFAQLPEARTLIEGRTAFFGEANRLAHSISPELTAGPELLARHEELVRLEQKLVEIEVVEALDLRVEHLARRPAHRDRLQLEAARDPLAGRAVDVGLGEDDQVRNAAGRVHQRSAVAAARDDPFHVSVVEPVAAYCLDDELAHRRAIHRRAERDRGHRSEAAVDMLVELEEAPVPGAGGLEHAVAIEHGMVEHGDASLRLRHELPVHVDDRLPLQRRPRCHEFRFSFIGSMKTELCQRLPVAAR